jgi:hypothetical protein
MKGTTCELPPDKLMNRAIIVGVSAMLLATGAALSAPPSAPAGHTTGEESAVLAALDRYVHAISTRDLRTMAAMQMPDGMTYVRAHRRRLGAL